MIKIRKKNLNCAKKSTIIVITLEDLEELLVVIAIYNTKYLNKIPVAFHNGPTYDYHFLIKQLREDFKNQFQCLGENPEKYINFSVPIKEDGNSKKIAYKLTFIDSYRVMRSILSYLVVNLSEINTKECPKCKRKCKFIAFKNNKFRCKGKECEKKCSKSIDRLVKNFPSLYKFCNSLFNKFILLLRKSTYLHEYMDSCEKFDQTSLPDKKAFYSKLNLEDTTDKDYEHPQKVWEVFQINTIHYWKQNIIVCRYIWKL